jgi:hypothetical protein
LQKSKITLCKKICFLLDIRDNLPDILCGISNDGGCVQVGEEVLLLRKFIQSRRLNSKLDYRYIGPFKVIKMVGTNAVELDIKREYPRLHPVFNVSLIVKYFSPNSLLDRGLSDNSKGKYYTDNQVVDWKKLKSVLDFRELRKGIFDYLISWQGATVGDDTWVSHSHFPASLTSYLNNFRESHAKFYKKINKKVGTV